MAVVLAAVGVGLGLTLWRPGRTVPAVQAHDQKPQTINVISHNQQGGITAHTVNVNATPLPSLRVRRQTATNEPQPDGGYLNCVELELDQAHAVQRIDVEARAPSITRATLSGPMVMFDRIKREAPGFAH